MKPIFHSILLLFLSNSSWGQNYKFDNVYYETISWNELFSRMENNPELLVYDIRTPGEQNDTSAELSTNQGKIKRTKKIDYYDLDRYYPELVEHKNDSIYLFCSHSMRSRRLSKQLSDSGFKYVINVNGGITYLNLMGNSKVPLRTKYYEKNLGYNLISALDFEQKIKDAHVQVIDVRPDSIYFQTGGDEQDKSYGNIPGIPHFTIHTIIDSFQKFKNKEIILFDNYGDDSPVVAQRLLNSGFDNVGILLFGLDQLRNTVSSYKRKYLVGAFNYILPEELLNSIDSENLKIIDVRSAEEFENRDSITWKNVGRIKKAINLPLEEITAEKIQSCRLNKILIYDNMMMVPDLYAAAEKFSKLGTTEVYILSGGLFMLRWKIANTNNPTLANLLED